MSTPSLDIAESLQAAVRRAYATATPVCIVGGDSKSFLGRKLSASPLHLKTHSGVLTHEPTELVVTARSGTRVKDLNTLLASQGQMLPFDPPSYTPSSTIGGVVASGLSGPRRPYTGAVRDFILGARLINGRGDRLRFGGEVMKNVAGYDLSRLMAGAYGTLGVLLDISFKVLPLPEVELTLKRSETAAQAIDNFNHLARKSIPLSAAAWMEGVSYLRLSGSEIAVHTAIERLAWGEIDGNGDTFWAALRDHSHPFFSSNEPLWRLSVPSEAPLEIFGGEIAIDWGGAQRWLKTSMDADTVWHHALTLGGHAMKFHHENRSVVFQPLPSALLALHQRIKNAFDPARILNPGRMYETV